MEFGTVYYMLEDKRLGGQNSDAVGEIKQFGTVYYRFGGQDLRG
jgi:hypothetical protein